MTINPLVSVIIPTYNRADKVGDAIRSVLTQTYSNVQILVIDDGSSDHTSALMAGFPQVEYIQQVHSGQAAARNNGLRNARGSIIANLDSDDVWETEFLADCVRKLEDDQLDFVFANWIQQCANGSDWDFLINDPFLKPFFTRINDGWVDLDNADLRDLYLNACPSPSSSTIIRKSSIGMGWDESINIGDDWALYINMIFSKQCKASFTLKKLWRKRVDSMNIYDGRKRAEVLNFLYIKDVKQIIKSHSKNFTSGERKILERTLMYSLVELSKHKLIREFNFIQSLKLFAKSCAINIPFTFKSVYIIFMKGLALRANHLVTVENPADYESRNTVPRVNS